MPQSDTIQITPELLSLVARIDEFKGAWRALGALAPNRLSTLRRVATIESIGSSIRIEGCKLSDQEVGGYAELMDLVHPITRPFPSIIGPARPRRLRRGRPAERGGQRRHQTARDPQSFVISGFICSRSSR